MLHWQLSLGKTKKWLWTSLFNSTFCQDYFVKATVGQSTWSLICSGIRGWKENYFQLRPEPTLSSTSTAQVLLLEEVLIPYACLHKKRKLSTSWNMHQKRGQAHAVGQSSSRTRNLWGAAWVFRTLSKKKKTINLLNISPAPQYFLSPEIYCLK